MTKQPPCAGHETTAIPLHALVRDHGRSGKVGEVMDRRYTTGGERIDLRPPGGGKEWTANAVELEIVQTQEAAPQ